ncbi:replication/maintenance protein RepL [Salinarchaeum laminariae]|uniref:replication/maintenance protein RepL n=1 Tax=Salinarchaeum laminariae TaxID=869888 RepID=UPI0020C01F36|nr:replication/maintenance protein RepL [Salinarchaeum laminariae]
MGDLDDSEGTSDDDMPFVPDLTGDVTPIIEGDTPDWFTGSDGHILFVLYTGLTLTPSIIAENTNLTRQTVSRRLETLQAGGFVEKVDRGKYKITKEGAFLVSEDPDIYRESSSK